VIDLRGLARLAATHQDLLEQPVAPFALAGREIDTDVDPLLMGVVNLSRDSTYRESVAVSTASAVRMARTQWAQGAHLIDIGAESSRATAQARSPAEQASSLVPLIEQLSADDIRTSIEGYDVDVVRTGLRAGASVVNLTGSEHDDEIFALAAEHGASVVLCHVLGPHARSLDGSEPDTDPVPRMSEHFARRIERSRDLGVPSVAIDPGLGFGFHLTDPRSRARYQATALLHTFRLRSLGVPLCHALPHAFDLFGDQFRSAEGVFAVLAHLGQTGIYRVHEVPLVRSVLDALTIFDPMPD
jgi:dihydropteroate synthase